MITLEFPTTVKEFAMEQERITGRATPEKGLEIYEEWVPLLNWIYEGGTASDESRLYCALGALNPKEGDSPALDHMKGALSLWVYEAYKQGEAEK